MTGRENENDGIIFAETLYRNSCRHITILARDHGINPMVAKIMYIPYFLKNIYIKVSVSLTSNLNDKETDLRMRNNA